jgi:hypothetical protein
MCNLWRNSTVKRGKGVLDLACCDCGLVHTISLEIKGEEIAFKFIRNERSTAQIRRHKTPNLFKKDEILGFLMTKKEKPTSCCLKKKRKR